MRPILQEKRSSLGLFGGSPPMNPVDMGPDAGALPHALDDFIITVPAHDRAIDVRIQRFLTDEVIAPEGGILLKSEGATYRVRLIDASP